MTQHQWVMSHEFNVTAPFIGLQISEAQMVDWTRPLSAQLSGQWCICISARTGLAEVFVWV